MTIASAIGEVESVLQTSAVTFWTTTSSVVGQVIAGVLVLFLSYKAIRIMMGDTGINYAGLTAEIGWIGFVAALLNFPQVWFGIVTFFLSIGPKLASAVIQGVGGNIAPEGEGLAAYVSLIIDTFTGSLLSPLRAVLSDISLFSDLLLVLGILILCVVYVVYIYFLIKGVLVAYFWIYGMALLGAIVIGFAAFNETRSIFWDALRIMLTNTVQLLVGSVGLAVTLAMASKLFEQLRGDDLRGLTEVFSSSYLVTLFVGIMSIMLFNVVVAIPGYLFKTFVDGRQNGPLGDAISLAKQATGIGGR